MRRFDLRRYLGNRHARRRAGVSACLSKILLERPQTFGGSHAEALGDLRVIDSPFGTRSCEEEAVAGRLKDAFKRSHGRV